MVQTTTIAPGRSTSDPEEVLVEAEPQISRDEADLGRRRFTIAMVVGTAVVMIPMLWLMWNMWSGTWNPLRGVPYDNFYDLQARAIFHGHLYLPGNKMGIEAFVNDGRSYTYFGLFPSLIRMPILLVTSSFDGQLTAPSILFAWLATSFFSSLMLWRVRILMRGEVALGRAEAVSYGALMGTIMGGSVILYLAATPFIYNEDFAWSVPLTVGSLFALLGVLERPTRGRVILSGVLILCANLDRSPPGWACVIVALLIAAWFAMGRGGDSNRRWFIPMLVVGIAPLLVSCLVTYAKFGIPVGLPMAEQVWTTLNAHRRYFLATNGGKAFNPAFLPSTLSAYFQPLGLRISGLFPFILPPAAPAGWLAGATLDQSYPTASFTDTSPLLLLLGCWGVVTAFRPRSVGRIRLTRFILLGGAAGAGGVLLWGYISQRYIADFIPFFIVAASIALVDLWRRLAKRSRPARVLTAGGIGVVAVYCVVANLAVSLFPVAQWTYAQSNNFISAQRSLSFDSLAANVEHGTSLPYWAPAGQLFAMNNCSGIYLSTGNDMQDVPGQQIEHYTWLPVRQSTSFTTTIGFTFNRSSKYFTKALPLLTYGKSTLMLEPNGSAHARIVIENSGTTTKWPQTAGWSIPIKLVHEQYRAKVTIDPNLDRLQVLWYGLGMINHYIGGAGPAVVQATHTSPSAPAPVVTIAKVAAHASTTSHDALCRSLIGRH